MKKPKRRTQEERRSSTRDRVIAAALNVLLEFGHSEFTTTKVAARAGVSRGAQENHFPTRTKLIAAAGRRAMDQAAQQARGFALRASKSRDPVKSFLDDSKAFFFSPAYFAMVELALGARSDSALAKIHAPLFKKFRALLDGIWADVFTQAGYDEKRIKEFLELTHYFLRGMVLAQICFPQKPRVEILMKQWEQLAHSVLGASKSHRSNK